MSASSIKLKLKAHAESVLLFVVNVRIFVQNIYFRCDVYDVNARVNVCVSDKGVVGGFVGAYECVRSS